MTHLEVQPDGRIFVIDGMPEPINEAKYCGVKGVRYHAEKDVYEKALASANRILCADQEKAAAAIALQGDSEYIKQNSDGLEIGLKPGIYQVPVEWEEKQVPIEREPATFSHYEQEAGRQLVTKYQRLAFLK